MQVAQNFPTIVLKYNIFFQVRIVFCRGVIKTVITKNSGIFDSFSKYANWKTIFVEKWPGKKSTKNFQKFFIFLQFFFEFLKSLIPIKRYSTEKNFLD